MVKTRATSFTTLAECKRWLNEWVRNYVLSDPSRWRSNLPSRCPLAEAWIDLREREDHHEILMLLRPHYRAGLASRGSARFATIPKTRR